MSKTQDSSFSSNTPIIINGTGKLSTSISWNTITTPAQFVVSTPSSIAAFRTANGVDVNPSNPSVLPTSSTKKSFDKFCLAADDEEKSKQTAARFASCLALDQISALYPNADTPFEDAADVVNRLLPYHVFQHPSRDLDTIEKDNKGKGKATNQDLADEIAETKFALECVKRKRKLEERFRLTRLKSGTRSSPDNQAYVLAQAVLESDRIATGSLISELRNARAEKDRLDREKRVASMHSRPSPYHTLSQPHYYRGHPYAYTQPYTPSQVAVSASMSGQSTSNSVIPPTSYQPSPAAIPFQIPVGSMPALQVLGIVPVPAASLPPADQQQPLAILRGSTANGTMLNLEINVPLLQTAQMNGLAIILNSLMSRGGESGAVSMASSNIATPVAGNSISVPTQSEATTDGMETNGSVLAVPQ